jgi:C4-type Zn-finger protein
MAKTDDKKSLVEFKLKCPVCSHRWTQLIRAGDDAPHCPKCYGPAMVERATPKADGT